MRKTASKELIRLYFLSNVGKVVNSDQLREASGNASEWARRVRELREHERWPILTHNDRTDLKPGEYLLKDAPPDNPAVTF